MKLEVKRLVHAPVGETEKVELKLLSEKLDPDLTAEIEGELNLTRLDDEILGKFKVLVKIKLICDRCAGEYETEIPLSFSQEYDLFPESPDEEKMQVDRKFEIDLSEPLRQEIIASLPVKKLCQTDCVGICAECGVNLNTEKCRCNKPKS